MAGESTPLIEPPDRRNQKTYHFRMTPVRRVLTTIAAGIYALLARMEVTGSEKFPAQGPVILAANHLSNYDVFPLQFSIQRPIFFMAKEELFRNPVMDWLLRELGGFPVYRGARDEWSLRHSKKILDQGLVLGMFPEGTRSKGAGLKPAKTGIARLALETGCPISPVALHGPQSMFRQFPRRTIVSVKFGEPLLPEPGETHLGLTDRLMFALAELLPPEERGVYRYHPSGF